MAGKASSSGRLCNDFNRYKNQEWLQRRKMRIEQVRVQSKEIAKALRQKVENEEKLRAVIFERIEEAKFRCWKAEKLDEMERKLRYALEEFGLGHKLAVSEPCNEQIIEIKNKNNMKKARERGEIAKEEKSRRKKLEEATKLAPIQRKKMTRKVEDLRSALLRSVTAQKQWLLNNEDIIFPNNNPGNIKKESIANKKTKSDAHTSTDTIESVKKITEDNWPMQQEVLEDVQINTGDSRNKLKPPPLPLKNSDTVWINLYDMQNSSSTKSQSSKTSYPSPRKNTRGVEFYDFHSRYHCKTFREYPNLVEKISVSTASEAINLKQNEDQIEKLTADKKQKDIAACEERGNEALRREKIKRDYHALISKLDDLNKKEKLIKIQQPTPTPLIYMNDERLLERTKTKQRLMNSKFECIYYNATSELPTQEPSSEVKFDAVETCCRDSNTPTEEGQAKLKFSPSSTKDTSSVTSSDVPLESPVVKISAERSEATKKKKKKLNKNLLLDIDRALEQGRKLRRTIIDNWENGSSKEEEPRLEKLSHDGSVTTDSNEEPIIENAYFSKVDAASRMIGKVVHNKESQTDDINKENVANEDSNISVDHVEIGTQVGNESLAASSSTSYKSPPSEFSCSELQKLLKHLGNLGENEDFNFTNNPKLRRKIKKILKDLAIRSEASGGCDNEFQYKSNLSPTLSYYISKLLNMSREKVANLSISSENTSISNVTAWTDNNGQQNLESLTSKRDFSQTEDLKCKLHQNIELQKSIQNWKTLFGLAATETKEIDKFPETATEITEQAGVPPANDYFLTNPEKAQVNVGNDSVDHDSTTYKKLDAITEKCTKRILELTDLLHKVRRDKEMLLNSNSASSVSSTKRYSIYSTEDEIDDVEDGEYNDKGDREDDLLDVIPTNENFESDAEISSQVPSDTDTERRSLSLNVEEGLSVAAVIDSQSSSDGEESLTSDGTLPDVMNELINRKIISSPFKWDNDKCSLMSIEAVDDSNSVKPSSIEKVICDFRKKMSLIKPFSLSSSGKTPGVSLPTEGNYEDFFEGEDELLDLSPQNYHIVHPRSMSVRKDLQESSIESMDNALTNLGLNWAKSFLRKIEKSNAIDSSSCSEERKSTVDFSLS